jgi:hypothetical protein
MLIKIAPRNPLLPSEITSEGPYAERRRFPKAMGLAAGAALGGFELLPPAAAASAELAPLSVARKSEMAGGEGATPYEDITHYNKYQLWDWPHRHPFLHTLCGGEGGHRPFWGSAASRSRRGRHPGVDHLSDRNRNTHDGYLWHDHSAL